MPARPPIPDPLKRIARQQCAFGCALCGKPVFEIDHIVDYSLVQRHDADNLVCLCRDHHRQKTDGLIDRDILVRARSSPFNESNLSSSPYNVFPAGNPYHCIIGDNVFRVAFSTDPIGFANFHFPALTIDNEEIFGVTFFSNQHALFALPTLRMRDLKGRLIVLIDEGEDLSSGYDISVGTKFWDIECNNKKVIVRNAPREIVFSLTYSAHHLHLEQATFASRGGGIEIRKDGLHFEQGGKVSQLYGAAGYGGMRIN